jgi:lipoyl(octanoyl) transferase
MNDNAPLASFLGYTWNMLERICQYHFLGSVPYLAAQRLQEQWAQEIADGHRLPTLLLLEHPHTYTLGRSGKQENVLWRPAELEKRGIALYWTDRGGDVTYHGPGQLVGYPLLPLSEEVTLVGKARTPKKDFIGYVRRLEEVLILVLQQLEIPAQRIHGFTGAWVQPVDGVFAKIASIGVKVDAKGISRHGFSLNVAPDMSYWSGIIPCGINGVVVTSMANLLKAGSPPRDVPEIQTIMKMIVETFSVTFGFTMIKAPDANLPILDF